MPRITIGLGAILIVVGVVAYIATAFASWTALLPAVLGAVLVACGLIGLKRRKIGIHIALAMALLGLLGTGRDMLHFGALIVGDLERPAAATTGMITFGLLAAYLILAARSFVTTRRWENAGA